MKFLAVVVVAAALCVALGNVAKYRVNAPEAKQIPKHCEYEGELYELESTRVIKGCLKCHCYLDGTFDCHTIGGHPLPSEHCKFKYNMKECKYELIPNEKCNLRTMVG